MGVFGRGRSPTAIIRDGVHATKIYVGEHLVWDGTRPALVNAVRAQGVGFAPTFGVVAGSSADVPVVTVTGVGVPPVVRADSLVTVPASAGGVTGVVPAVSADSVVVAPVSTAAAASPAPTGAEQVDVTATMLAAGAAFEAPMFVVSASFGVAIPVAVGSAAAGVPEVSATGSAVVAMPVSAASAVAVVPAVSASSPIVVPAATGGASARVPGVSLGGSVTVPASTGSGLATPFVVSTAPLPAGMDKSGTFVVPQNVYTKITGWSVRSGYPSTSIVNDSIVVNGSGTVNVSANISRQGVTLILYVRIMLNGVQVATGNTGGSNVVVSANSLSVQPGDVVSVEGYRTSTTASNGTITAASFVTVTPV